MISIRDLDIIEYKQAWELQQQIFAEVSAENCNDTLLFCEHQHVYTLGKSGHKENILVSEEFLQSIGAAFFAIDRGGDITYHGPGQLVGYPILNLEHYGLSLKGYIELLEQAVIDTIAEYGIKGFRADHATGVWINTQTKAGAKSGEESETVKGVGSVQSAGVYQQKICAIGVRASRFVTMHGFALNVNTNLDYFKYINPCGFTDRGVTSLEALLGRSVEMSEVKKIFSQHFTTLFEGRRL